MSDNDIAVYAGELDARRLRVIEACEKAGFPVGEGETEVDAVRNMAQALMHYRHVHEERKAQLDTVKDALDNAIEDILWCGAANVFSPAGKAHAGWIQVMKRVRGKYTKALETGDSPSGSGAS